ncbi:MAG TPA: type 1 glutamine amidotransferase [Gammaproteobacteria bacterium]
MRLHWFQHVPFEGLGAIERWALQRGMELSVTRFYAGDQLPRLEAIDWLVVMGGPMNIYEDADYPWLAVEKKYIGQAIAAGKKVVGICLGAQLIADVLGAPVTSNAHKEIGWFPVELSPEAKRAGLGTVLPWHFEAFHWHGDTFAIPPQALPLGHSEACAHQGFLYDHRVLGLQFHLEMTYEGASELILHGADELWVAPYIQDGETMLADPQRFTAANHLLWQLLDYIGAQP